MKKFIFGALIGAVAGAAASYFVTKKMCQDEFNQELEELKEHYINKEKASNLKELKEQLAENIKPQESETENVTDIPVEEENDQQTNYGKYYKDQPKQKKVEIVKKSSKEKSKSKEIKDALEEYYEETETLDDGDEEDSYDIEMEYYDHPTEGISEKPYSITPLEFANTNLSYDKFDYVYYEDDDILVDDQDNIINDLMNTVGEDFETKFGEYEADTAYIRNERMGSDFIIDRVHGKFTRDF